MKRNFLLIVILSIMTIFSTFLSAQNETTSQPFSQLDQELPTANNYRTASGAPGHEYWQQQADYKMALELDDAKQRLSGEETVTFTNNSPDPLSYLWLQLDQNIEEKNSDARLVAQSSLPDETDFDKMQFINDSAFDGGFKIDYVTALDGKALPYTIVKTMMRIDLAKTLNKGEKFSFKIKWWFNLPDRLRLPTMNTRNGFENFPEDGNNVYTVAQFFPRMCNYLDNQGWQHKQFLGKGEFTLPFGNYEVSITVPADHLIAASGTLQNADEILTAAQKSRLESAKKSFVSPVVIATEAEAKEREKTKVDKKKTWIFKADNVRDFAFASSRKFIWDAMGVQQGNNTILAMSMYPKEGNPLWEKFSTKAVAHTLKWYTHYTIDYPYPVAWSIHSDKQGMEYPMICFNRGRPEKDGTYTENTKYGMIGVIIHEVGHNYFPMIINSDERQWTWMDEGLNTFTQCLAEQEWERDYPTARIYPSEIVAYMKSDKSELEPIMTNSESVQKLGANAYAKTATGLNILRETIMGRDLFDFAFKTYSNRWKFKHPSPADFFRTMEDASGIDLDWFWRGWFYTTETCDIALDKVRWVSVNTKNPDKEFAISKKKADTEPKNITQIRNKTAIAKTQDEIDPAIRDFYSDDNPFEVTKLDKAAYDKYMSTLSEKEKKILLSNKQYYEITFNRVGDLVMPLIVEFEYTDGSKEEKRIPAEIWRFNQRKVTKVFVLDKEVKQITLDPHLETADVDMSNNYFPPKQIQSRFEIFKAKELPVQENAMQRSKRAKN